MNRGAVRFDFPNSWIVGVDSRYVRIVDRKPPEDRCGLIVSCRQVSLRMMDAPMHELLRDVTAEDEEDPSASVCGPIIRLFRPPLEAAWRQMRLIERFKGRDVCTRICMARGGRALATIIFDFWPEDELNLHEVWSNLLETLAVGDFIEDPASGRRREKRG